MNKLWLATGTALAAVTPMAAHAQAAPTADWRGAYIGVSVGGFSSDVTGTDLDGYNTTGDQVDASVDGWSVGGQFGYDWRFNNNVVLGVSADGSVSDSTGDGIDSVYGDTVYSDHVKGLFSLRARGGFVINDRALIYATAGVAWLSRDLSVEDSSTAGFGTAELGGESSDFQAAPTYGAGAEFRIRDNATIGIDWQHIEPDDVTVTGLCTISCAGATFPFKFEQSYDFYKATLNFSF